MATFFQKNYFFFGNFNFFRNLGERLKVLRIEENCLEKIPTPILKESKIAVLYTAGNLFTEKELQNFEGYDEYSIRFTDSKQKAE